MSLNAKNLKDQFAEECHAWKLLFADNLRKSAQTQMLDIFEYIRVTSGKVSREVVDLESLNFAMGGKNKYIISIVQ
jgi:hypothetical protein